VDLDQRRDNIGEESGTIPARLFPQLRLPRVTTGESCPVTPGVMSTDPYVGGQQYGGSGPVWVVLGDRGDRIRGMSVLGNPEAPGGPAAENVWLFTPGYPGPFTVRGGRLDGRGAVRFGGTPASTAFVEPPARASRILIQIEGAPTALR
jgi:hypothetical protein